MINAAVSCYTLRRLRKAILTSGVVLIYDKCHPHSAVVTHQLLEQFKWDVSAQPANSAYFATSDFYLFPELKNWVGGQSFQKNENIQRGVKIHLKSLATTFFENRR
ncbi:hypothetical protein AVEN_226490-1 [Araneus ventricosus]|uniref:Histone-lysine N-methyltransferase SETMAR n=1 Tax=Araneus ventricosus TaxID=182803 RepID=A0A4Y2E0Y7_ARAVE|nr:hypothetical protein AVEN_226490-1 [Araneus ventricosus]